MNNHHFITLILIACLMSHFPLIGMYGRHNPIVCSHRPGNLPQPIASRQFTTLRAQKQIIWLRIKASQSFQQEKALKLAHRLIAAQTKDCLLFGCTAAKKCKTQFVCLQEERELLLDYRQAKRERIAFENELKLHRRLDCLSGKLY